MFSWRADTPRTTHLTPTMLVSKQRLKTFFSTLVRICWPELDPDLYLTAELFQSRKSMKRKRTVRLLSRCPSLLPVTCHCRDSCMKHFWRLTPVNFYVLWEELLNGRALYSVPTGSAKFPVEERVLSEQRGCRRSEGAQLPLRQPAGTPSTQLKAPTVTSIPVDSCAKPPALHSPAAWTARLPPADLLKRWGAVYVGGVLHPGPLSSAQAAVWPTRPPSPRTESSALKISQNILGGLPSRLKLTLSVHFLLFGGLRKK